MAGDPFFDKIRLRWRESNVGTNAGVSVDHAAATGRVHTLTGFQASGDAAALVTVETPAGTVIWRKRFAGAFTVSETFPVGELTTGSNALMRCKISASTANCEMNLQGYEIAG